MALPERKYTDRWNFETAIDLTEFGKYNISMLVASFFMIMGMYMDVFGLSVLMPSVACDMALTTSQQGFLSAVPLIGVIVSSYIWGLAADTIGRRKSLLIGMPIGFLLGISASIAPTYSSLTVLKMLSVMFTSAANAAAFTLTAESVSSKHRCRFMFILSSAIMLYTCVVSMCAIPVFQLNIHKEIPWLNVVYRPWRLVLQIICLPSAIGVCILIFLKESPKFLLSKERNDEAIEILRNIFQVNTGYKKETYVVTDVFLDEEFIVTESSSFLMKIWNQTAPLFKPPLLKNSVIIYYVILCAFMTSTGFTMWVPTMTNAFFINGDNAGRTFCDVVSQSNNVHNMTGTDCDKVIQPYTLYATMVFSGVGTVLTISLSFLVGPLGKKFTTLMVFVISLLSGILLIFVRIPLLSIALFYMFIYVAQILGNINSYLTDLNPTHVRAMASCLSVVVARGFGFISVQLIAILLSNYCTPMLGGYIVLVLSGLVVATFLPTDSKPIQDAASRESSPNTIIENIEIHK